MKKSEMEDHHDAYLALEDRIRTMSHSRQFPAVFSVCVESFPHIVAGCSRAGSRLFRAFSGPETLHLTQFIGTHDR